jgi:hypothetical protein
MLQLQIIYDIIQSYEWLITEILLKVALSTINQPTNQSSTIDGDYEIQVIEKIQKTGAFDFNFVNVNSYKII